jgi:cytochrome c biogenesis protein CcmG/thiol:disulfide interchange protein DsbE
MMSYRGATILLLLLAWLLWQGLHSPIMGAGGGRVGSELPSFELDALHSNLRFSNQDLPNTAFLLNIWASWCAGCRHEHGYLEALSASGIKLVGLNYRDAPEDALAWLERHGDPFLFHISDTSATLALDLGVSGAPESFVVDGEGVIRHHHIGVLNEHAFRHWREWLIAGADPVISGNSP